MGGIKLEGFSHVTVFERRRSESLVPPWRWSFQQSRQLHSIYRLSPLDTSGSKEAFICEGGKPFPHVAFRVVACVSVRQTAWTHSISLDLLVTGAHTVVPHALDLSMIKGERRRQDPLLGCYQTENSYH